MTNEINNPTAISFEDWNFAIVYQFKYSNK